MRGLATLALTLACAVLGALAGLATMALHPLWWGLPLGVVASVAAVLAVPRRWAARPPFGLAWVVPVALGAGRRPEGDFVVAADTAGYLLLVSALVVLGVSVWSVAAARRPRRDPRESGDPTIAA